MTEAEIIERIARAIEKATEERYFDYHAAATAAYAEVRAMVADERKAIVEWVRSIHPDIDMKPVEIAIRLERGEHNNGDTQ